MRCIFHLKLTKFILGILALGTFTILLHSGCGGKKAEFGDFLIQLKSEPLEKRQQIVDHFIDRQRSFPIVEDTTVYFILREKSDTKIYLSGDMNAWAKDSTELTRVEGTDLYITRQSYPLDARIEYKYIINDKYLLDPLNTNKSQGGFGENSVVMMPMYIFPTEILARRSIIKGSIDTLLFKSKIIKDERKVYYYHHPKADQHAPLIIFHDGQEYLEFAYCKNILENLISDNEIPALNALFVNPKNRTKEYWMNDSYLKMLFNELIPFIKKKYNLGKSIKIGMGGASLGGLISLYALKDYSQKLNFVFSQSGAFWVNDDAIVDILNKSSFFDTNIYFDYGCFERIDEIHKRLIRLFEEKNIHFSYNVYNEGHSWGNWGAHLDDALKFVFKQRSIPE